VVVVTIDWLTVPAASEPTRCAGNLLRHVGVNAADHAERAGTIGALGRVLDIERGLGAEQTPVIDRRQDRRAAILRHRILVEKLRPERKIPEGIDRLAGRPNPVRHLLVKRHHVGIDLVGELHHRGLDDPFGQFADVQGQLFRREAEIDALLLVHREGGLALDDVLVDGHRAVADGEVGRTTDRNRVARLEPVLRVAELGFVRAMRRGSPSPDCSRGSSAPLWR
jgi:hypothetical protein